MKPLHIFVTSLLLFSATLRAADESPERKPKDDPAKSAAIEANLKALSSDEFDRREAATKALIDAGDAASPLLDAAMKGKLEPEVLERIVMIRTAIPQKHPERILKLIVKKPAKALMAECNILDEIAVSMENISDQPVMICKPRSEQSGDVDGNLEAGEPRYTYKFYDANRKRVGLARSAAGNHPYNASPSEYFVALKPGKEVAVLPAPNRSHYAMKIECPPPGKYTLVVEYTFTGRKNPAGIDTDDKELGERALEMKQILGSSDEELALEKRTLKCRIQSEPIEVEIVSPEERSK